MSKVKLLLGDCYQRLAELEPDSVDLLCTDPPYILDTHGGTSNRNLERKIHSNHIGSLSHGFDLSIFDDADRVLKYPNYLVFCSNKQISTLMEHFEAKKLSTTLLVWHKTNPIPFANGKHLNDAEFVVYARGKGAPFNNEIPIKEKTKVLSFPSTNKGRIHPTEKPVDLMSALIQLHSLPGQTVLDPFMGSGTTGVSCVLLNRKFVGIEQEKSYFKIAKTRMQEVL